jgi:hypothetical protein
MRRIAIAVLVLSSVMAGCGSSKDSGASSNDNSTFKLSEFVILPPESALHAGRVKITADNVGGEAHELVIVAAQMLNDLPVKRDGSMDASKIPARDMVGEINDVAAGSQKTKTFTLKPGSYVALCNLVDSMHGMTGMSHDTMSMGTSPTSAADNAGHVHYARGMRAMFEVAAR